VFSELYIEMKYLPRMVYTKHIYSLAAVGMANPVAGGPFHQIIIGAHYLTHYL
jgi:hypothetical protein